MNTWSRPQEESQSSDNTGSPLTIFLIGMAVGYSQWQRDHFPYAPWPDFILDHADQHSG